MRILVGDDDLSGAAHIKSMLELLLLEDSFLPLVMNWAAEEDWSDLLLFLLETDSLRFPSILAEKGTSNKSRFIQDPCAITRIVNSYIVSNGDEKKTRKVGDLLSLEKAYSIKKLMSYGIPLAAVFSVICDRTWQRIMKLGENLPSKKCIWSALRKSVVEEMKLELVTVMKKENYRSFLIRFLQSSPAESACLHCCLQVRDILDALEKFKYPSIVEQVRNSVIEVKDNGNSVIESIGHQPDNGSYFGQSKATSEFNSGPTVIVIKRKGSFFATRKPIIAAPKSANQGSSSIAVRGGGDNLVSFATPGAPIAAAASAASQAERGVDYSDTLGAFALLLQETRKLHRKFFNSTLSSNSSSTPLSTSMLNSRGFEYSNTSHGSINSGSSTVKGSAESPSAHTFNVPCAGPSETLRLELTATLAQTSSVHLADVDTLESFIAMTFAGRLEKLLCEVERETFQHLQLRFPLFLASPEYVYLVAQEKAEESKKVRSFRSFNSFLDYVKENNESPFLDGRSVDEVLEYKFGPQEPDLRAFVKGKVFVYHGEEFTLHLNRYGSFCGDDDVSDDGHQEKSASRENYPSPIPESLTPDGISVRTPDIESLCDLYPTLSVRSAEPIVRPISITKSFLDKRRQSNRWEESLHSLAQDEPECSKAAFQLPFMVDCLSPRHCVQLSMLLCSNMSVVIVSLSPDLLTATLGALPLLAQPLSLSCSHTMLHLASRSEIDKWWDLYLSSYHLAVATKQNSRDSRMDQRKNSYSYSSSGSRASRPGVSNPKSYLTAANSIDFYGSQMLSDFSFNDCKCAADVCVFDLDTLSITSPHDSKFSCSLQNKTQKEAGWKKDLLNTKTFQCYNSPAFRAMHIRTSCLLDRLRHRSAQAQSQKRKDCKGSGNSRVDAKQYHSYEETTSQKHDSNLLGKIFEMSVAELEEKERKADVMREVSEVSACIQETFNLYFTAIFYHALPATVLYYPTHKIVACDLRLLQSQLRTSRESVKVKPETVKKQEDPVRPQSVPLDADVSGNSPRIPLSVCPLTPCTDDTGRVSEPQTVIDSDAEELSDKENSSHGRGQMQRHFSAIEDREKDKDKEKDKAKHMSLPITLEAPVADPDPKPVDRCQPFKAAQHVEEAFSNLVVTSPAFFDLIKRHGPVLLHFRF